MFPFQRSSFGFNVSPRRVLQIAEKLNTRPYKATGFILAILIYVSVLRIDYFGARETF